MGDVGSIPGSGRSAGEGNGYPLQYSGLENSTGRGAWQATVHGVTESQTRLSNSHLHSFQGGCGNQVENDVIVIVSTGPLKAHFSGLDL